MRLKPCAAFFLLGAILSFCSSSGAAQQIAPGSTPSPVVKSQSPAPRFDELLSNEDRTLPEAPTPQVPVADPQQQPQSQQPAAPADSSSAQGQQPAPDAQEKSQHDKAEQQIREQEHQRVLGVVPNFNISYRRDAVSLTPAQKIKLAVRSATDPVTFGVAVVVAGYGEAADSDSGFPWGAKGFAERAGAKYLDAFDGTMLGNGILPALLHQDPRFFRLGHGSAAHRLLYAVSTTFICRHDNSGRWEPNISNVGGNIAAGALSNLYYPGNDSGIGLTIGNGLIVTAEGTLGGVFDEFWPDISRHLFHRDPTHGLDGQARAADAARKDNKKQPSEPAAN